MSTPNPLQQSMTDRSRDKIMGTFVQKVVREDGAPRYTTRVLSSEPAANDTGKKGIKTIELTDSRSGAIFTFHSYKALSVLLDILMDVRSELKVQEDDD